jgi:hypothetical protein
MNEQISLAYSLQPSGTSSIALSIIPTEDGSLNTAAMLSANISSPSVGSPEAILLASVSEAVAAFRSAKGF